MRQEEDVEQCQLVNGDLLLHGKAEHVDVAAHVVRACELRAQNRARLGIVDDLDGGVGVVVLDERGLLAVRHGCGLHLDARALRGGLGEARGHHLEVKDADARGALHARRLERGAADVVAGDDARANGVGGKRDVAWLAVQAVVEDGGAVAHGVDVGDARHLVTVHEDGAVAEELHARIRHEPSIGPEADADADHVHVVGTLVGDELGDLAVDALEVVNALAVVGLDAVVLEVLGHHGRELGVEVVGHAGGGHVNQQRVAAVALECLGQFHADVTSADHSHGLDVGVLQLLDDLSRVLEQLHLLDVLQVSTLKARDDGKRARGQDQLVVRLGILRAVLARGVDNLALKVDAINRGLHVDGRTLGLELLLGLVEQAIGAANLVADPQGHAAAQEADVGVCVEGDDLVALVVIQDGVDGGGASMVGTHNDDLAHSSSSRTGWTYHVHRTVWSAHSCISLGVRRSVSESGGDGKPPIPAAPRCAILATRSCGRQPRWYRRRVRS